MTLDVRQLRDAIAAAFEDLPGVQIRTHGGRFDLAEVKRWAIRTPALIVTCLGASRVNSVGSSPSIEYRWAIFVLTKDAPGLSRVESGLALTEVTLARVHDSRWNASNARIPEGLAADNLYSGDLDRQGIAIWAVTWTQALMVSPQPAAHLDALRLIAAEWRNIHGTDVAADLIELEQE